MMEKAQKMFPQSFQFQLYKIDKAWEGNPSGGARFSLWMLGREAPLRIYSGGLFINKKLISLERKPPSKLRSFYRGNHS